MICLLAPFPFALPLALLPYNLLPIPSSLLHSPPRSIPFLLKEIIRISVFVRFAD